MNDLSEEFERLQKDLRRLEQRLDTLDSRLERVESRAGGFELPLTARPSETQPNVNAPVLAVASESSIQAGSLFQVFGKALLGIAGAYVLRAIENSKTAPRLIVAVAGILYAFLWLFGAARVRKGPRAANSIYAGTSVLILAPMLWELTLRFNVLSPAAAAAVVCAFVLAAFALTWKSGRNAVVRVAAFAAAALVLALAAASHDLLPFVVALLLLTAVCEFVPGCDRLPDVAALFALAADALIWILIYVYFAGPTAHEEFPALTRGALLAPSLAIFAIGTVSVGIKTILRARQITAFETVQTIIAFLLAAVSLADFAQAHSTVILGVACLVLSAGCYTAVFTVFARASDPSKTGFRNRTIFAAWSAMLLLAGSFLCLPHVATLALLGAAALLATWLSRRKPWAAFALYGMVFLIAAAGISGLFGFVVNALAGSPDGLPSPGSWSIATCAVLCCVLVARDEAMSRPQQVLHLAFAALATSAVMTLLISGLVALTALCAIPEAHHVALIRTVVLCAAAIALVYGGTHWRRRELRRLGYAALALVAVKLLVEDLRHGHLAYIAASIFLVAFTLIAAPRAARAHQKF